MSTFQWGVHHSLLLRYASITCLFTSQIVRTRRHSSLALVLKSKDKVQYILGLQQLLQYDIYYNTLVTIQKKIIKCIAIHQKAIVPGICFQFNFTNFEILTKMVVFNTEYYHIVKLFINVFILNLSWLTLSFKNLFIFLEKYVLQYVLHCDPLLQYVLYCEVTVLLHPLYRVFTVFLLRMVKM